MKVGFFITVVLYLVIAVIGVRDATYMDLGTKREAFDDYIGTFIIIAVVLGAAFYFWLVKWNGKSWAKEGILTKIAVPIFLCGMAFYLNRNVALFINSYIGQKQHFTVTGKVAGKYAEKRRRGYDHFLLVVDTVNTRQFMFEVSEDAYNANPEGYFNKQFTIGSLGIIYRRKI